MVGCERSLAYGGLCAPLCPPRPPAQSTVVQRSALGLSSGQSMTLKSFAEGGAGALAKTAANLQRVQSSLEAHTTRVREEIASNTTPAYMERPVGMNTTWR